MHGASQGGRPAPNNCKLGHAGSMIIAMSNPNPFLQPFVPPAVKIRGDQTLSQMGEWGAFVSDESSMWGEGGVPGVGFASNRTRCQVGLGWV